MEFERWDPQWDEAVRRALVEYFDGRDCWATDHTVQITSFGGSGTTALCDHLQQLGLDVPKAPGMFPVKHRRYPNEAAEVPAGFRVVYPYGDPRNAVVSLFRRNLQAGHYRWLRYPQPRLERGRHVPALDELVDPDGPFQPRGEVRDRLADLGSFLAGGVDEFRLEDHVDRWLSGAHGYPVLFVRYEALEQVWPEVREFLGLAAEVPCLRVRERSSDWRSLPRETADRLDALYGPLAEKLAALPAALEV